MLEQVRLQAMMEGDRCAALPENAIYMRGLQGDKRRLVATLLENQRNHLKPLSEMTKLLNIGHIDKVAYPTIRAVYANTIAGDLVSMQPLSGPVGLAFYMDVLYGSNKGSIGAGQTMFDARTGPFGDESYATDQINGETATLAAGDVAHTLSYFPVRPGTFTLVMTIATIGSVTATDDGAGNLVFSGGSSPSGTINYDTGVIAAGTTEAITAATATYRYDSEASDLIGEVDIQLTSVPITATPHKLRSRISWEAMMQMEATNGMSAAQEVAQAMTEALKHGIDRGVINDLYNGAGAGEVTWDRTVPFGVSWTDHKKSFVDSCSAANNLVFRATKRGNTNWMVAGVGVCDVVETLENFVAATNLSEINTNTGVQYIGMLAGRWRVYKDPFMVSNTWVQGYKGNRPVDAGYAYCPWIPLFTSPEIMLDDLIRRQAIASMYGKKLLNKMFYVRGRVIN